MSLALLISFGAGCQKSTPDDAEGSATGTSATTGADASSTANTGDSDPTGGDATHEVCEDYLACVGAVAPEALPDALATYGTNGTCWTGSASQIELCLETCRTGKEMYHDVYPDAAACAFCTTNADCDAGQLCFQGDCAMPGCGDGLVTDDEVCDGQEGCDADCQGPGCGPLTNAGCGEELLCVLDEYDQMFYLGECVVPGGAAKYGEGCVESACAPGLACVESSLVASCGEPWCCTNACDLNAPESCPAGATCTAYDPEQVPLAPWLSYLGRCLIAF